MLSAGEERRQRRAPVQLPTSGTARSSTDAPVRAPVRSVEARVRYRTEALAAAGLPFPGQDSYVMNIMVAFGDVIVFALIESVYWLRVPDCDPVDPSPIVTSSLHSRLMPSLITCISHRYSRHYDTEIIMIALKSGIVHLVQYDRDELIDLTQIRNTGPGDDPSVWSAALAHTRPLLAVSSNTTLIELVDIADLNQPRSIGFLAGHGHNIPSIEISENDQLLISASIDGTGRVWHLASLNLLYTCVFEGADIWGWAATFFPVVFAADASLSDCADVDFDERFRQLQAPPGQGRGGPGALLTALPAPIAIWSLLRGSRPSPAAAALADADLEKARSQYLGVFCNQIHLFLCDSSLHVLDFYQFCQDDCQSRPTFLFAGLRCRVALLRCIPALSLILFCCSHARQLTLLRVVRRDSRYRLQYVGLAPNPPTAESSIIGLDVSFGPRIATQYDHEDFWCVHVLYSNGVLCCLEIQRDLCMRSRDLLSVTI